eukprot:804247-Prorocentrum_minimum.AAC.4
MTLVAEVSKGHHKPSLGNAFSIRATMRLVNVSDKVDQELESLCALDARGRQHTMGIVVNRSDRAPPNFLCSILTVTLVLIGAHAIRCVHEVQRPAPTIGCLFADFVGPTCDVTQESCLVVRENLFHLTPCHRRKELLRDCGCHLMPVAAPASTQVHHSLDGEHQGEQS